MVYWCSCDSCDSDSAYTHTHTHTLIQANVARDEPPAQLHRGGIPHQYIKVPTGIQYTDNAVPRSRPVTGNQEREQEQDKRQRLECFVHRVSTIVLRVSCIVFRVMVASSAPMQQSGAERYLTQAYSKQEQPRASIRVHVLVQ